MSSENIDVLSGIQDFIYKQINHGDLEDDMTVGELYSLIEYIKLQRKVNKYMEDGEK